MGFTEGTIEFLETADADFSRTITLGRQLFHWTSMWPHGKPVDPFLEQLGAREMRSLDVSDYEQATDIWDLNDPLPDHLRHQFTAVIDGGTLQSVFNFSTALRNVMELVAPDGMLIIVGPCNNCSGNNFYQYSPDLFFRALSKENGFEIVRVLVQDRRGWYQVADPLEVGKRLAFTTSGPARLYVQARRVSTVAPFLVQPQQAHYQLAWSVDPDWRSKVSAPNSWVRRHLPNWLRDARASVRAAGLRYSERFPTSIGRMPSTKKLSRHLSK